MSTNILHLIQFTFTWGLSWPLDCEVLILVLFAANHSSLETRSNLEYPTENMFDLLQIMWTQLAFCFQAADGCPPPHIPIDTLQLDTPVEPAFIQSTKNVFKVGRAILERESWSQQRLCVSLYISTICKLTLHHTMHILKKNWCLFTVTIMMGVLKVWLGHMSEMLITMLLVDVKFNSFYGSERTFAYLGG